MKAWIAALVLLGAPGQEQAASPVPPAVARPPVRVRLETALGAIEIEVDAARAQVTAANFLRYVERGDYDGGRFHRTVPLRRLRPGDRRYERGAPDPRRPRRRAVAHPAGDDPEGETSRPAAYRVSSIPGKK